MASHILKKFDTDIGALIARLLEQDDLVAAQLEHAMTLLVKCHREHGPHVAAIEEQINALDRTIDGDAAQMLALHQPSASDLRVVLATMRIASELEQIGNATSRLCTAADHIHRTGRKEVRHLDRLVAMHQHVVTMLRAWRHDYATRDVTAARAAAENVAHIATLCDELDELLAEGLRVTAGAPGPRISIETLRIAEALKEIAERAARCAAHVAYMVRGEDIRFLRPEQVSAILAGPAAR